MLKNKNLTKKSILIALAVVVLLAGGALAAYNYTKSSDQPPDSSSADDGINYNPPSEEEKRLSDLQDNDSSDPNSSTGNTDGSLKSVTPIITSLEKYGNNVEASSRVPGINENGGKCTLVLKKGSEKVSANREGVSNVTEVSCGYISIPLSKLSSGVWSATVKYSSSKAQGVSAAQNIEI